MGEEGMMPAAGCFSRLLRRVAASLRYPGMKVLLDDFLDVARDVFLKIFGLLP